MYQRLFSGCILIASIVLSGSFAAAQSRIGSSGMSAFGGSGSSGFGSSGFGGSGFGSSSMGGGGFGNSGGFGSGGFGSSGFGGSGFGSSSMGGGGFGGSGFGGSSFGNQGFGAGSYSGGQTFVGRDSGDMAAVFNQMGRAGTQYFNQMNRNMNRNQRDQQAPAIESVPQAMRVNLQVAFNAPRPTSAMVSSNLRTRLGKILTAHNIAQPLVTMEGETAVLAGVAATESQRLVLERLVAMEPGVRQVRNEMIVIQPAAAVVAPATGN